MMLGQKLWDYEKEDVREFFLSFGHQGLTIFLQFEEVTLDQKSEHGIHYQLKIKRQMLQTHQQVRVVRFNFQVKIFWAMKKIFGRYTRTFVTLESILA